MSRRIFWVIIVTICISLFPIRVSTAQDGAWSETFDDPALPGWDHSPGVSVTEGVLRIEPGNFAGHGGDWIDFTLTLSLRQTGSGGTALIYHVGGEGSHILVLAEWGIDFQRESEGQVISLSTAPQPVSQGEWHQLQLNVAGDAHTVTLDGTQVLSVADPDSPVRVGGIGFESLGEMVVEVDNLTLTMGTAPPQPEQPSEPAPPPEQPAEVVTGEAGVWVRTGGPPGGLGYDIRYNFSDPNIWYVTDNFAGVHISTDNGYTWQPSNTGIPAQLGPTGDWRPIFSLTVDPLNSQIVWVGTDVTGHIYKSTDGGQTWQQKDQGIVNEWDELTFRGFTIDPRSSDIVYAMGETSIVALGGHNIWSLGDGGVVYKTTDGGENWSKIWDGDVPSALTRYMWINPNDSDVIYVSTGIFDRGSIGQAEDYNADPDPWGGLGILKSTDGGQTWRILGKENGLEALYVGSLYMHPQNPDILLAAVGHEMGFAQIDRLRQEGHSPAGIYRTMDGGETWIHVYEPPLERVNEEFSAVEFCVSDPNIAYAGSGSAIYRSEDAGVSWTQMTAGDIWGPPGVRAGWPIDLQCDPFNPNRLFANNYQGGAFLSEDGGSTWTNASQGYTGAQMFNIVVDPRDSARVYVIGRSGGWRSDDGGTTWVGLRNFTPGEPHPILAEWGTIALNPANPDQIWASDGDGPVIIGSQDRGASWTIHVPPEGVQGTVLAYAFTPADPNTIYAGYGDLGCLRADAPCAPAGGVIVSRDGGQNWTLASSEALLAVTTAELAVDSTNAQIVYAAATESGLLKTVDGGATWNQLDLSTVVNPAVTDPDMLFVPQYVQAVTLDPANPQHIMIGVHMVGIFASYDGGASWQPAYAGLEPNGSIHDIVFDPTNSQIVYASDRLSGVYRSTDGGQTWVKINDGLENRAAMWLAISADGQYLYASTDGQGVYRLALDR
jgi:photosystem II stability/assembly factor-like uncharacterized protein